MIDKDAKPRVWYVVFAKSQAKHWLLDRLKYSHVYACRKSPAGTMWTVIDPTTSVLEAQTIPRAIMPEPQDYSDNALAVVRVEVRPELAQPFSLGFGVLSCVTVIKALLCNVGRGVYTPCQLFKSLEAQGGRSTWKSGENHG